MVAQLRGAVFVYNDELKGLGPDDDSRLVANHSLDDVVKWLGFNEVDEYLLALSREREQIFKRAKD